MIRDMARSSNSVLCMNLLAGVADVSEVKDWHEVKAILVKYWWLEEACDNGGQPAWREVSERRRAMSTAIMQGKQI